MTCEVKTAEPAKELSWSTVQRNRDLVRWRYQLEPVEGGTDLTESFEVIWLPPLARIAEDFLMRDRDRRREDSMHATLNRIKEVAERATV